MVDAGDLADLPVIGVIAVVIALAGLAILVLFVAVPIALALAEVALLLALAALAIPVRVLLRRPWDVVAHHPDGRALRWRVVGWRESGRFATEARELLGAGIEPPGAEHLPSP